MANARKQPKRFESIVLRDIQCLKKWNLDKKPGFKDKSLVPDCGNLFCNESLDDLDSEAGVRAPKRSKSFLKQTTPSPCIAQKLMVPPNSPVDRGNTEAAQPNPYITCLVRMWDDPSNRSFLSALGNGDAVSSSSSQPLLNQEPTFQGLETALLPFDTDNVLVIRDDTVNRPTISHFTRESNPCDYQVPEISEEQNSAEIQNTEKLMFLEDSQEQFRSCETSVCASDHVVPKYVIEE